jgi:CRISPR-associated endonuclease/helicase Cas3
MSKSARGRSGGIELTDAVINRLAEEAERGYDPKRLRPRVMGRPRMGSRPASAFQVRLEPELRAELERAARRQKTSPSELARRALRSYLKRPTGSKAGSARPK